MSVFNRPTSPYLSVYRLQVGSFFSIFTRISGVLLLATLSIPLLLFSFSFNGTSFYLVYLAIFFVFKSSYTSAFFSFALVLFFTSLLYHLFSAARYLLWSSVSGLSNDIFSLQDLKRTQGYLLFFPVAVVICSWIVFLLS